MAATAAQRISVEEWTALYRQADAGDQPVGPPPDYAALRSAVLAGLTAAGAVDGEMVLWSPIRDQIAAEHAVLGIEVNAALLDLVEVGEAVLVQVEGSPVVGVGDEFTRRGAALAHEQRMQFWNTGGAAGHLW